MSTSLNTQKDDLEAALAELAVSSEAPTAAVIDDLVRRHPEHADEIRAVAVDLVLEAARGHLADEDADPEPATSPLVAKAMASFRAALGEEAASPFADLDRAGFRALVGRLNASSAFLLKVRDRVIDAGTMTEGFRRKLSAEMSVPVELLTGYLAGPPALAAGVHYKADERPTAGATQTFEEAVRSSGLTPEQQAYLLAL
jgi:hypothetical protein